MTGMERLTSVSIDLMWLGTSSGPLFRMGMGASSGARRSSVVIRSRRTLGSAFSWVVSGRGGMADEHGEEPIPGGDTAEPAPQFFSNPDEALATRRHAELMARLREFRH